MYTLTFFPQFTVITIFKYLITAPVTPKTSLKSFSRIFKHGLYKQNRFLDYCSGNNLME